MTSCDLHLWHLADSFSGRGDTGDTTDGETYAITIGAPKNSVARGETGIDTRWTSSRLRISDHSAPVFVKITAGC